MTEKIPGKRLTMDKRRNLIGWCFLLPAALLIAWMSFWPMIQALLMSFQTGKGARLDWASPFYMNFARLLRDKTFITTIGNTFFYLIVQVPIMLIMAIILASMLNNKTLKFKGFFRTCIFLPCATALVSYAIIFRSLFAQDGFINTFLMNIGIMQTPFNWLNDPWGARIVIIIGLLWRWTGYNMVFYLSALQNIDYSVYEAARIDGAGPFSQLTRITIPLLKPTILVTAIMSTNGTLQLFDESFNLTRGGPANASMSMSHYLYNVSFQQSPNFGYAAAISYVIFIFVAVLALVQMKVGDQR